MRVARLARIITVAVMVAGIDHGSFDPGGLNHGHEVLRVKLAIFSRVVLSDMVVDQQATVAG